jgi:hypothetical protein
VRPRHAVLLVAALAAMCLFASALSGVKVRPFHHQLLSQLRVYAYRDWQSTAYSLHPGDRYEISAKGKWLYSPIVGLHGPAGSKHHISPPFYPLPGVPGGALIGRVGEDGQPFYVGAKSWGVADRAGRLYLCIDDDRLGDNSGKLSVDITIVTPQTGQPDAATPTTSPSR